MPASCRIETELLRKAGPAREVPLGKSKGPVAAAPRDADFAAAAVWRLRISGGLPANPTFLLRVRYRGDVARVTIGDRLVGDDFFTGRPLEIGLWRHADSLAAGELRLAVLPLRPDAPVYLAPADWPRNADGSAVAELDGVELVPQYSAELTGR